jgi:uncharacterized protein (TIGR02466 family)
MMESKLETWIESSDVLTVFPTFVWKTQLTPKFHTSINANILSVLEDMQQSQKQIATGEAWQSEQALHELEELQELNSCITTAAKSVLKFLSIGCDDLEITGCWANIYSARATHGIHSHPNNFLSGVYYVKTQPGADTINFHDPRLQTGIIRPPVTKLTAENTDQVVVRVQDGLLLLFPSFLQHSVDANQSDARRISISFNLMFSRFTEDKSKPLW